MKKKVNKTKELRRKIRATQRRYERKGYKFDMPDIDNMKYNQLKAMTRNSSGKYSIGNIRKYSNYGIPTRKESTLIREYNELLEESGLKENEVFIFEGNIREKLKALQDFIKESKKYVEPEEEIEEAEELEEVKETENIINRDTLETDYQEESYPYTYQLIQLINNLNDRVLVNTGTLTNKKYYVSLQALKESVIEVIERGNSMNAKMFETYIQVNWEMFQRDYSDIVNYISEGYIEWVAIGMKNLVDDLSDVKVYHPPKTYTMDIDISSFLSVFHSYLEEDYHGFIGYLYYERD